MRYRRSFAKYARYGVGLALGAAQKRRSGRSYTKTKRKKSSSSGVTHNRDNVVQYRKSRMPTRKRKQWKKFVNKVAAANERSLGTKTIVLNKSYTGSTDLAAQQVFMLSSLYGMNGTNTTVELGNADVYRIFQEAYLSTKENQKLTFKSAVMDMTLTNSGTTRLEVDLYHLTYWGLPTFTNFANAHTEAAIDTPTMNPNGTGYFSSIELGKRGVSPFDMPQLIKYAKFTVQKKVKYWIDIGETATFQIRDPKTHVIDETSVLSSQHWCQPRLTQTVLIVFKSVTGTLATGSALTMGVTRKYSLNSVDNSDEDGYVEA